MNQENKIVGIGYNGMPNGCNDDLLPWSRSAQDRLDTKYPYGESAAQHLLRPFLGLHSSLFNKGGGGGGGSVALNVMAVNWL